jgi:putative transposase
MEENKIITLRQPGAIADPLTEVLRDGARALLAQAIEAEVSQALAAEPTPDRARLQSRDLA